MFTLHVHINVYITCLHYFDITAVASVACNTMLLHLQYLLHVQIYHSMYHDCCFASCQLHVMLHFVQCTAVIGTAFHYSQFLGLHCFHIYTSHEHSAPGPYLGQPSTIFGLPDCRQLCSDLSLLLQQTSFASLRHNALSPHPCTSRHLPEDTEDGGWPRAPVLPCACASYCYIRILHQVALWSAWLAALLGRLL